MTTIIVVFLVVDIIKFLVDQGSKNSKRQNFDCECEQCSINNKFYFVVVKYGEFSSPMIYLYI